MKKNRKNNQKKEKKVLSLLSFFLSLPEELKRLLTGIFLFFLSLFFVLSLFEKGGFVGNVFILLSKKIFGKSFLIIPFVLFLGGLASVFSQYKKIFFPTTLSLFLILLGTCLFFETLFLGNGGILGKILKTLFLKIFGPLVSQLIGLMAIFFGCLIILFLLKREKIVVKEQKPSLFKRIFGPSLKVDKITNEETKLPKIEEKKEVVVEKNKELEIEYKKPPLEIFEKEKGTPLAGDIQQNSIIIKNTLENFGIKVEMGEVNVGPTVTQYTLKPAEGVKVSKITSLSNDLALALAAHPIRIEAPIPGKSLVGIEIPNKLRTIVRLRDLFSLPQFQNSPSPLTFVLGRDVSGTPVFADLARMPHLLVAGSTGSGKTIFLNSLILSLIYRNSPKILNLILIDPKRVEFPIYTDLPHLLTDVIFDAPKAVNALKWLIEEMERRFKILADAKTRNISGYNKIALENKIPPMSYIILIIDELADLMAARGKEIEAGIVRLAQLARAVGIHLVLATQRPSTEVITGLIKANITARVAFQVASQIDSRTILDTAGAEKLLGMGDLLFSSPELGKPRRIQGAYVSENEVKKVVDFLKAEYGKERKRIDALERKLMEETSEGIEMPSIEDYDDPLYEEAKKIVIESRKASASLLQRRLKIGYARAARLLDILEERGIVGPAQGAKPREVYFKEEEEWEKI